jgi:hypothetical protein
MKTNRIFALVILLFTLLMIGCDKAPSDKIPNKENTESDEQNMEKSEFTNSNIKLEGSEVVFRGKVTSVEKKEIVMEIVDSEIAFGTYRVLVSEDTPYFDENGREITKENIEIGEIIEVVFSGQVMNSFPPQIAAKRIYLAE